MVTASPHHTLHHLYNRYNYGQFLTLFDCLFGTYHDPAKEKRFDVMFPAVRPSRR